MEAFFSLKEGIRIVQVCVCIQYVSMHVMPYLMIFPLGFPC